MVERAKIHYLDPTEEMNNRWFRIMKKRLPTVDLIDISSEVFSFAAQKRQFAPEYSHTSYLTMLQQEFAIGDYLADRDSSHEITHCNRQTIILLINELSNYKRYKIDTFFLAVSLVDRYLAHIHLK